MVEIRYSRERWEAHTKTAWLKDVSLCFKRQVDAIIRATPLIALTVVAVLAVGLLFGGSYVLSALSDCSGNERAIVGHYPHYDNRHIATYPWTFSCSVRYTTTATRKEALGYYADMLRQNGWEVMGYQTMYVPKGMREDQARGKRPSDLWGLPRSAGGTLVASRNGYSYWVSYEPPNREDPDIPNDKALVTVSANDHPPPASSF